MILTTPRLVITPMGTDDAYQAWLWKTRHRTGRLMHTLLPADTWEQFQAGLAAPGGLRYAVHLRGSIRHDYPLMGCFWSTQMSTAYPEAICAVIFDRPWHGKGYAKEAAASIIPHAESLGVQRFAVYIDSRNLAAVRLAREMGFGKEGIMQYPGRADLEVWARLAAKGG